jgi:uncharacterized protein
MNSFNKSICKECQENCCKKFYIILEEVKDRDWIKWLSFHQGVTIKKLGARRLEVWFDLPCSHLGEDQSCQVYEKRPQICRKFTCEKLQDPAGKGEHKKASFLSRLLPPPPSSQ